MLESSDKRQRLVACIGFSFWMDTDTKRSIIRGFTLAKSVGMITVMGREKDKKQEEEVNVEQEC